MENTKNIEINVILKLLLIFWNQSLDNKDIIYNTYL
jgi:hypothetical protein